MHPEMIMFARLGPGQDINCQNFRPATEEEIQAIPGLWRENLGKIVGKITCDFWHLNDYAVTCFFPHDPSVPTDPYPVATIIVDLLFDKPDRTPERRHEFAKLLAEAVRDYLNKLRETTDAKVEVVVKPFNAEKNGFYVTS